jgi:hypothetical protein
MTALRDIPAAVLRRLREWGSRWLRRFDPSRDDDEDDPFPTDRSRRRSSSTNRRPTSLFNAPVPVLPQAPAVSSIPIPERPATRSVKREEPVEAAAPEEAQPFPDEQEMGENIHVELSGESRPVTAEELTARAQDARSTEVMDPVPVRKPPLRRSVTERTTKKDTEITARMPKRATSRLQRLMAPPDQAQLESLKAAKPPPKLEPPPPASITERRRREQYPSDVISWPGEQPVPPVPPTDRFVKPEPPELPPLPAGGARPGIGEATPPPDEHELGNRSMNHQFNQRHGNDGR